MMAAQWSRALGLCCKRRCTTGALEQVYLEDFVLFISAEGDDRGGFSEAKSHSP